MSAPDFATELHAVVQEVEALLLQKNAAYGDSALSPVRIFSQLGPEAGLRVRIDDKLSRLLRGRDAGEDVELDLLGYLLLLRVARRRGPDGGGEAGAPTQGRTAEGAVPSSPPSPPSIRAPGPRSAASVRAARHYFERRERQFRNVPAGVTFEAWLASSEGVAWTNGTPLQGGAATPATPGCNALQRRAATPCNAPPPPSHSPLLPENSEVLEEEEGRVCEGESVATPCDGNVATPATATAATLQRPATPPPCNALEVLANASRGRVSGFASSRDQLAMGAALADVGLVGVAELEAFGRALAGDGASKLWPKSEGARARGALTVGFFLGRAGDARMLADGVTRWREAQARAAEAARPVVAPAAPAAGSASVASTVEFFQQRRAGARPVAAMKEASNG